VSKIVHRNGQIHYNGLAAPVSLFVYSEAFEEACVSSQYLHSTNWLHFASSLKYPPSCFLTLRIIY